MVAAASAEVPLTAFVLMVFFDYTTEGHIFLNLPLPRLITIVICRILLGCRCYCYPSYFVAAAAAAATAVVVVVGVCRNYCRRLNTVSADEEANRGNTII